MAVTITATDLATAVGFTAAIATRLLPVATALVNAYAPTAPDAISNEAVVRAAGWLHGAPKTGAVAQQQGDIRTEFLFEATGVLTHSGAKSLLSPFKRRRAGKI